MMDGLVEKFKLFVYFENSKKIDHPDIGKLTENELIRMRM